MQPTELIRTYWNRIQERDWPGVAELLHPDLRIFWPASRELFTGRESFVAMNQVYPEGWSIRVLDVFGDGDRAVSEVEVPQEGVGVFRVVSLWTVRDGLIASGTEYWVTYGGDPVPPWRLDYVTVVDPPAGS